MSFQNIFSQRIKQLRLEKGLSQLQLSIELGVTRRAVGHWESGYRIPALETLLGIAAFFKVSMDYLTGYDYLSNEIEQAV